jgi:hypothetical protein
MFRSFLLLQFFMGLSSVALDGLGFIPMPATRDGCGLDLRDAVGFASPGAMDLVPGAEREDEERHRQ